MSRKPAKVDLNIYAGTTFEQDFVYGCGSKVNITDFSLTNPAVVTAPRHGFKTGQTITINGVKGTIELNEVVFIITVIDNNSFSLDTIDATGYGIYLSGGYCITPIDLTGSSAIMHVRSKQPSDEVVVELNTSDSSIVLGNLNGKIKLRLDAAVTAALDKGKYVYDIKLISSGGEVSRFVQGSIVIDGQVTR